MLKGLGFLIVLGLRLALHSWITLRSQDHHIGASDLTGDRSIEGQGHDATDTRWPFEIAGERAMCFLLRQEDAHTVTPVATDAASNAVDTGSPPGTRAIEDGNGPHHPYQ